MNLVEVQIMVNGKPIEFLKIFTMFAQVLFLCFLMIWSFVEFIVTNSEHARVSPLIRMPILLLMLVTEFYGCECLKHFPFLYTYKGKLFSNALLLLTLGYVHQRYGHYYFLYHNFIPVIAFVPLAFLLCLCARAAKLNGSKPLFPLYAKDPQFTEKIHEYLYGNQMNAVVLTTISHSQPSIQENQVTEKVREVSLQD